MNEFKELDKANIKKVIEEIEALNLSEITIEDIDQIINSLLIGYRMQVPRYELGLEVHRGRVCCKPINLKEVTYPSSEYIIKYGRVNDINEPWFYGATTKSIILFELDAQIGDTFIFSKWKTTKELLLTHVGFSLETAENLKSTRSLQNIYQFVKDTNNFNDLNTFVYNYLAGKFTPRIYYGEENKYKLSIAIARILTANELIEGIMYPSIAMAGNADNIALKTSYVDKHLDFVNIIFGKVTKKENFTYSFDILDSATNINTDTGEIMWSGRNLYWCIRENYGELHFQSENGEWVAYDQNNNKIEPE